MLFKQTVTLWQRRDLNFGDKVIFQILWLRLARRFKDILELIFDIRYGTNSSGVIFLNPLSVVGSRKEKATWFASTPGYEFRKVMKSLSIDASKYTFIDFGCGKGKVLLYACDFDFRRVVGIEFSDYLAGFANSNIAIYDNNNRSQVIVDDAAEFELPHEPCVVFLANPFSEEVTSEIIANVLDACQRGNRDIYIIWYNITPYAQPLFDTPWLEVVAGERTTEPWRNQRTLLQIFEFSLPFTIFKVRADMATD